MAAGRPGRGCQPAVSSPILGPSITRYEGRACPLAGTGSRRAGHSLLLRGLHLAGCSARPLPTTRPWHPYSGPEPAPLAACPRGTREARCPRSSASGQHGRLMTCAPRPGAPTETACRWPSLASALELNHVLEIKHLQLGAPAARVSPPSPSPASSSESGGGGHSEDGAGLTHTARGAGPGSPPRRHGCPGAQGGRHPCSQQSCVLGTTGGIRGRAPGSSLIPSGVPGLCIF